MISIVIGRPGQGKTLFGVAKIVSGLADKKTLVCSNIEVKFHPSDTRQKRFKLLSITNTIQDILSLNLEDIYKKQGYTRILLIIDEIQTIMNSRRWEDLPPEFEFFMQQHRHYKFDIIGLTQSVKRADAIMRELVQFCYKLDKIFTVRLPFKLGSFGFFFVWELDPDSIESPDRKYDSVGFGFPQLFFADPTVMDMYDTFQEFPVLEKEGKREVRTYVWQKKETVSPVLVDKKMLT